MSASLSALKVTIKMAVAVISSALIVGVVYEPAEQAAAFIVTALLGYMLGVLVSMKAVVGDIRRRRGVSR